MRDARSHAGCPLPRWEGRASIIREIGVEARQAPVSHLHPPPSHNTHSYLPTSEQRLLGLIGWDVFDALLPWARGTFAGNEEEDQDPVLQVWGVRWDGGDAWLNDWEASGSPGVHTR